MNAFLHYFFYFYFFAFLTQCTLEVILGLHLCLSFFIHILSRQTSMHTFHLQGVRNPCPISCYLLSYALIGQGIRDILYTNWIFLLKIGTSYIFVIALLRFVNIWDENCKKKLYISVCISELYNVVQMPVIIVLWLLFWMWPVTHRKLELTCKDRLRSID